MFSQGFVITIPANAEASSALSLLTLSANQEIAWSYTFVGICPFMSVIVFQVEQILIGATCFNMIGLVVKKRF